nr:MAG TPA: hypothetical protein [Herelleviridae sp.]
MHLSFLPLPRLYFVASTINLAHLLTTSLVYYINNSSRKEEKQYHV